MSQPDIYWTGQSGRNYGYWIHPIEASFRKIAGNVIFARQSEAGEWEPVYIGQSTSDRPGTLMKDLRIEERKIALKTMVPLMRMSISALRAMPCAKPR
jgi:hypothetical protein